MRESESESVRDARLDESAAQFISVGPSPLHRHPTPPHPPPNPPIHSEAKERLLRDVLAEDSGIVITTYEHVKLFADVLLPVSWGYVVLDEGHKIRNPDADVTVVCKQMRTVHR